MVSNPIREYLQIVGCFPTHLYRLVSNPIREYLQIIRLHKHLDRKSRFKPYKGVSSNLCSLFKPFKRLGFKPYKGVSSNIDQEIEEVERYSFKPYKGVSSNKRRVPRGNKHSFLFQTL